MSTLGQTSSVALQEEAIARFCDREGLVVVRSYVDKGKSGLSTRGRTALQTMLRDVLAGPEYAMIVVADVSRWGRYPDPDEAAHYEFMCRSAGVPVIYCTPTVEEDVSPASTLIKSVQRLLAVEFSEQKSAWTLRGQDFSRRRGGWVGGEAPFGFSRRVIGEGADVGRILKVGERKAKSDGLIGLAWGPEAEVRAVRRVFDLYVNEVRSVADTVRVLNADKVVTRQGHGWTARQVRAVLKNELVIGILARERTVWRMRQCIRVLPRAAWTRRAVVAPMISKARFEEAQRRLAGGGRHRNGEPEILAELRRLLARHGSLDRQTVKAHGRFPPHRYVESFGSLQAAFRKVGYARTTRDAQHVEAMDRGEMIARIAALLAQTGYLSGALIRTRGDVPSPDTLRRMFGSLNALYREVGVSTDRGEQLREAWSRRRAGAVSGHRD